MKNKIHGAGLGLRSQYFNEIVSSKPPVPWFEILADNYLSHSISKKSILFNNLEKIINNYPVTLHCVGMSLGSAKDIDYTYLKKLKNLIDFTNPVYISDHLSWGNIGNFNSHELLPIPYTDDSLKILEENINRTQDYLGRKILIENVSSYISYKFSKYKEWDFMNEIAELTGCEILLDINNIYVNSINHKFDANTYIENINKDKIAYFHIAGHELHEEDNSYLIDTHGADITEPVWNLLKKAKKIIGPKPCLLERDNNIPEFDVLNIERQKIENILKENNIMESEIV